MNNFGILRIRNDKAVFSIDRNGFTIGKAANNSDGIIDFSSAVSRLHCKFHLLSNGIYGVEDLNSVNGTYINGYYLTPLIVYELHEGDKLQLADVEFDVEYRKKESKLDTATRLIGTYKAYVYGDGFNREIILNSIDDNGITIGTYPNCQICLLRERFLTDFMIRITRNELGEYVAYSCDSVCFYEGDSIRKDIVALEPGICIEIRQDGYQDTLLYLGVEIEFPEVGSDYDFYVDAASVSTYTIGGSADCDIRIDDAIVGMNYIRIESLDVGYNIFTADCEYGVKVNGTLTEEECIYIKNDEFFELYGYSFCISNNVLYTSRNANIITELPYGIIQYSNNHLPYPKYIRNVRQKYEVSEEDIEVLAPKPDDNDEEKNLMLTMMPMLLNMLIMVVLRGVVGGGGMFVLYCGATMLVSGSVSIITSVSEIKSRKEKKRLRKENYLKYISEKESTIIDERQKEKIIANHMNPDICENIQYVNDFSNRLFERDKTQEDYLSIRLGNGAVASKRQITYKSEEYVETEDELADYPQIIHQKYEYLNDMPVMLDLRDVNAVGCIGSRSKLYQMAKNIIIQFSTSHFYKELKLFVIIDSSDVQLFEWARWLQNTYNDLTDSRNFMYDAKSNKAMLEFLYSELSQRESMGKNDDKGDDYVVLVYRSDAIRNHPVSNYVSKCKELGFRFIFFEEYEELLNFECESRIFLNSNDFSGYIQSTSDGNKIQNFTYNYVSGMEAEKLALKLACVYVDEVSLENSLTKNISLFELLGIMTPYDLALGERWTYSKIYKSMAAPIGVKSGDEIVYLDLHEKYHGPHGLVAGTTGSGKSEILQTYILSMATLYHPYDVGFVIIDFKGGGMANQFKALPHLIGTITNMDGNEVERSLKSIKAELYKRQEAFAEYGVNHIDDYIKLFKAGTAVKALPHLILIVDEFAELKSEYPDFMKELISTARIGRSLGIHLILATQKPSGIVNDQIWSNSKFKLCLKVQNKSDSNEVLKSPLAAEIREPGRAYLQVGNNEIFQLFQSAYSGGSSRADGIDARKKYKIHRVNLSGQRQLIYERKPVNNDVGETQLEAIVSYIASFCDKNDIISLQDICLPPLKKVIAYNYDNFHNDTSDIVIPVGLTDDPSRQMQYVETFNFSQSNIFIMGASQSGKTNLLQGIIRGLTSMYSPKEVCIYIMDFASMILRNFDTLKHVGGVVTLSEDEKLKSLFKMLKEMINERKNILSQQGLSSYSSYRESGAGDLAQIVVLLDNWIAFRNYYSDYEETFINICRESASVGISIVVTSGQANGSGYKLLSSFAKRTALYCNDTSDYTYIFDGCRMWIDNIQGRGIVENKKDYYECQYYLAFDAEKEYERIAQMKEYISMVNEQYSDMWVRRIPEMPNKVTNEYVMSQFAGCLSNSHRIPLGIRFDNIELVTLDLTQIPIIGFVGKDNSGRVECVTNMVRTMLSSKEKNPIVAYILDDAGRTMGECESMCRYSVLPSDAATVIDEVYQLVETRYKLAQERKLVLDDEALILIVVNSADAMIQMTKDKVQLDKFKSLVTVMKGMKVCFLCTNVDNAQIIFGACEALKQLRDNKEYVVFENIKDIKVTDIQPSVAREYKNSLEYGDAYYISGSDICKIRAVR